MLATFSDASFKKVADVVVGAPPADYQKRVQAAILKDKQSKSDKLFELQKQEKIRKKLIEKKQKEVQKAKEKAAKEARKKIEEAKKKAAAEAAKKKGEEGAEEEEKKEEKEEDEEKAEEEEQEDEEMEAEEPETPPKVELTEEEKKMHFKPADVKDLAPVVLSANFTNFSLPSKGEGFDDIRYEWSKGDKATEYLKQWILDRKINSRVEELKPSPWFYERLNKFQKVVAEWKAKQTEFRSSVQKKALEREARKRTAAAKLAKAKVAATQAAAKPPAPKKDDEAKKDGEEVKDAKTLADEAVAAAEKEVEEAEAADADEKVAEEAAAEDFKSLDIFGVEDILDLGKGMPLFKDFQQQDWALMGHVFELNLLVHAFAHDVADPERPGVHINHLGFYYKKYFKKDLSPKDFGVDSVQSVLDIAGDSMLYLTPKEVVSSQLDGDFESLAVFAKLAEAARRHRQLRISLGEEGAALKLANHIGSAGKGGGKDGGWRSHQHKGSYQPYHGKGGKSRTSHPYRKGGKDGGKGKR